jgi:hypothetical protein
MAIDGVSSSNSATASRDVRFDQYQGTLRNDYAGYGKALAGQVNEKGNAADVAKKVFGMGGSLRKEVGGWDSMHSGDSSAAAAFVNHLSPERLQQAASDPGASRALTDSLKRTQVSVEAPNGMRYTEAGGAPSSQAQTALQKLDGARAQAAQTARGKDLGVSDQCGFGGCPMTPPPSPAMPDRVAHFLTGNSDVDGRNIRSGVASGGGRVSKKEGAVQVDGVRLTAANDGGVKAEDLYGGTAAFAKDSDIARSVNALLAR